MILGAGGFLGRHVRAAVAEAIGWQDVVCVGRSRRDPPACPWHEMDLVHAQTGDLRRLLAEVGADAVVNCAGTVSGPSAALVEGNILIVAKLVDAVQGLNRPVRVVQLGSAAEYGPTTLDVPVSEDAPERPSSPYGETKRAATRLLMLAAASGSVQPVTLRVFNPIGAGVAAATLLGQAAHRIRRAVADADERIELGPLDSYRDFVDAHDVARAVALAVQSPDVEDPILNIARGEAVQARQLVRQLADIAGYPGDVLEKAGSSPRSGATSWQQADVTRADKALGWSPRIDLETSLREVWRYSA